MTGPDFPVAIIGDEFTQYDGTQGFYGLYSEEAVFGTHHGSGQAQVLAVTPTTDHYGPVRLVPPGV